MKSWKQFKDTNDTQRAIGTEYKTNYWVEKLGERGEREKSVVKSDTAKVYWQVGVNLSIVRLLSWLCFTHGLSISPFLSLSLSFSPSFTELLFPCDLICNPAPDSAALFERHLWFNWKSLFAFFLSLSLSLSLSLWLFLLCFTLFLSTLSSFNRVSLLFTLWCRADVKSDGVSSKQEEEREEWVESRVVAELYVSWG